MKSFKEMPHYVTGKYRPNFQKPNNIYFVILRARLTPSPTRASLILMCFVCAQSSHTMKQTQLEDTCADKAYDDDEHNLVTFRRTSSAIEPHGFRPSGHFARWNSVGSALASCSPTKLTANVPSLRRPSTTTTPRHLASYDWIAPTVAEAARPHHLHRRPMTSIYRFHTIFLTIFLLVVKSLLSTKATVTSNYTETLLATQPDYKYAQYTQLADFLDGPALSMPQSLLTEAICQFRPVRYAQHFPHAMQQFYRCLSWWLANPGKPAVLVTGHKVKYDAGNNFVQGFLGLLESAINLTVVDVYSPNDARTAAVAANMTVQSKNTGRWPGDTEITDFAILDPQRQLRQFANAYIRTNEASSKLHPSSVDWSQSAECRRESNRDQKGTTASSSLMPRITILNRPKRMFWPINILMQKSRHLANAHDIKNLLEAKYVNQSVPIVTFSHDTTFAEQVNAFYDTDVLISPHGAQLIGLSFLPPCASVFEIFPHRYLVAEYFGTLASSLNLHHGFVYVNEDVNDEIPYAERFHYMRKGHKRNGIIEPDAAQVAEPLDGIIETWRACVCRTTMNVTVSSY